MTWRVAYSIEVFRAEINALYPGRNKASDGTIGDSAHASTASDHNPDKYGIVRAIDITHDPKSGCDIGLITDELCRTRDPRIKYVIANRLIMSGGDGPAPWVWRSYDGSDPHTNHLHLSVVSDSSADNIFPWGIRREAQMTRQELLTSLTADRMAALISLTDTVGTEVPEYSGRPNQVTAAFKTLERKIDRCIELAGTASVNVEIDYVRLAAEIIRQLGDK